MAKRGRPKKVIKLLVMGEVENPVQICTLEEFGSLVVNKEQNKPYAETLENRPKNYGKENCECGMCKRKREENLDIVINHGEAKGWKELKFNEVNRVPIVGDVDFVE